MTRLPILFSLIAFFAIGSYAQQAAPAPAASPAAAAEKPKRAPAFRANKEQIKEAQTKLKTAGTYAGEATGSYDEATRAAIKVFQKENGLRASGSLNRATLEKMSIVLTDAQKAIPVPESSFVKAKADSAAGDKPKRVIFRATKDQIREAQEKLKAGKMYDGEATGKLDDATRAGLRKFQEANGLKVTGTLNRVTLEKMGVTLTEKQKADAAAEVAK